MNELFERELINTTINDVSLADYVKKNYVPMSVIEDIKADIEASRYGLINDGLDVALRIIDKHTEGSKNATEKN